jgi:hypothetical protein
MSVCNICYYDALATAEDGPIPQHKNSTGCKENQFGCMSI